MSGCFEELLFGTTRYWAVPIGIFQRLQAPLDLVE